MAGTLTLDTVIGHVLARGGSVRLIGDNQQLAAIEGGPPHAEERPRVGNFDEQKWGVSVSAVSGPRCVRCPAPAPTDSQPSWLGDHCGAVLNNPRSASRIPTMKPLIVRWQALSRRSGRQGFLPARSRNNNSGVPSKVRLTRQYP